MADQYQRGECVCCDTWEPPPAAADYRHKLLGVDSPGFTPLGWVAENEPTGAGLDYSAMEALLSCVEKNTYWRTATFYNRTDTFTDSGGGNTFTAFFEYNSSQTNSFADEPGWSSTPTPPDTCVDTPGRVEVDDLTGDGTQQGSASFSETTVVIGGTCGTATTSSSATATHSDVPDGVDYDETFTCADDASQDDTYPAGTWNYQEAGTAQFDVWTGSGFTYDETVGDDTFSVSLSLSNDVTIAYLEAELATRFGRMTCWTDDNTTKTALRDGTFPDCTGVATLDKPPAFLRERWLQVRWEVDSEWEGSYFAVKWDRVLYPIDYDPEDPMSPQPEIVETHEWTWDGDVDVDNFSDWFDVVVPSGDLGAVEIRNVFRKGYTSSKWYPDPAFETFEP